MDEADDLADELKLTADFIAAIGSERRNTWIIESNHDRHLDRYLTETDWKKNLENAETFLAINLAHVRSLKEGNRNFSALSYALRLANPAANFIKSQMTESLRFFKTYYQLHGDKGSNGSPGSNTNFKRMGLDIAAAHDHSPSKHRQLTRLGCIIDTPPHARSSNNLGHSICIEQPDGSMQLIPIVDGKWRA